MDIAIPVGLVIAGILGVQHFLTKMDNSIEGAPVDNSDIIYAAFYRTKIREPRPPKRSWVENLIHHDLPPYSRK
jgi:hypothetical protein